MKKRRIKRKKIVSLIVILGSFFLGVFLIKDRFLSEPEPVEEEFVIIGKSLQEVEDYAKEHDYTVKKEFVYDKVILENIVVSGTKKGNTIEIIISKGKIPLSVYQDNKVNELGKIPIMMYHGIVNTTTTKYVGGNVDKDGYNRTVTAFKNDLEFYYENNYRMIRLIDYVGGNITTELGKSPLVLTFDDGREDNFKVLGKNADGSLEIDPNSAVGILEEFKNKYPDFNVTATFFLNYELFQQKTYNEDILKWLIENGYDVGNHTTNHADIKTITASKTEEIVGKMYEKLASIIPDKYVQIVALPFGSPYVKSHSNFSHILKANYNSQTYETLSTLRVGWEPELSPYHQNFDQTFLKRCRAYDNNGQEFDIKMVFNSLKSTRYVSDGDLTTVVIKQGTTNLNDKITKEIIKY